MAEDFEARAATWDDDPARRERTERIARLIRDVVTIDGRPRAVELGAGTGLLSRLLADQLGPTTLLDASPGMVAAAEQALRDEGINDWTAAVVDLDHDALPGGPYHLALAQMALHHIHDVPGVLARLHSAMTPDGRVALADLDHDAAGLLHAHKPGFDGHHGFARQQITDWLVAAGFRAVQLHDAGVIGKEVDGERQRFPLFLAVARA
ncbi:MAG: class I SAM-dependent methyltransferase [Propionibacteriaceae bacterium]|nr:class I SAM-dependent methyltransferase [Propionibacteriaceae bacterium]